MSELLVKTGGFCGPIELLLEMVRKGRIDIRDVALAGIADQYAARLAHLLDSDWTVAGEGLLIAAVLVRLKTRALLPEPPPVPAGELERPEELAGRAEVYAAVREAGQQLYCLLDARRQRFWRSGVPAAAAPGPGGAEPKPVFLQPAGKARLPDLVGALRDLLQRQVPPPPPPGLPRRQLSVDRRLDEIRHRLRAEKLLPFDALFPALAPREELVVTFLALLELVRLGQARAEQDGNFGPIVIVWVSLSRGEVAVGDTA